MDKSFLTIMPRRRNTTSLVRMAGFALVLAFPVCSTVVASTTCHPLVMPATATRQSGIDDFWYYILPTGLTGMTVGLETKSLDVGTFDLGAAHNQNYASCSHCVKMYTNTTPIKYFFQDRGLLKLSVAPGVAAMPVEFENLRLVEVTFSGADYASTPVPGGQCYEEDTSTIFVDGFES